MALAAGCRTSPLAEQCRTLSDTANRALDEVESLCAVRPPEQANWAKITVAYESLDRELKAMKIEEPRLAQATTEYQATIALAAVTTRSLATAVKRRRSRDIRQRLHELKGYADQHKRLSQRIDRLCHSR